MHPGYVKKLPHRKLALLLLAAVLAACASRPREGTQVQSLREAAAQGSADAQEQLGDLYAEGHGVPRDEAAAAAWYEKSAAQGNNDARYWLGEFALEGRGVARDPARAADYFRQAAEASYRKAQYALGALYARGWGVQKNTVEGYKWISMSAGDGDEHAQAVLKTLSKSMTAEEIAKAEAEAKAWQAAHGPGKQQP